MSRSRPPSQRSIRHAWLTDLAREIHAASYEAYGARRVHAELVLGRGVRVGHTRRAADARAGIAGRTGAPKRNEHPRRGHGQRPGRPQSSPAAAPNELWVTDITEHPTREGQRLLRRRARRLQPPRRRLVDRRATPTAALTSNALGMAIEQPRARTAGATLIHSDHGTQFTSWAFTERADSPGSCRRWDRSATATTTP